MTAVDAATAPRAAASGPRRAPGRASVLLVAAGDRTLRWARVDGGALGAARAERHDGSGGDWRRALTEGARPERVVVAAAAGAATRTALADCVAAAWGLAPEFVVPRAQAGGLHCGAVAPPGVDRWLALVAARRRAGARALALVSCGTAFAVDVVSADGDYRGGYLVPGPAAMREALFARTGSLAALAALAPPATRGAFGVNTAGAMEAGTRVALAALVERAIAELAGGASVMRLLTGDEAGALDGALGAEALPELALEGLAAVAAEDRP